MREGEFRKYPKKHPHLLFVVFEEAINDAKFRTLTIKRNYEVSNYESNNIFTQSYDILFPSDQEEGKDWTDVSGSSKAKNLIKRALVFNEAAKRKYCQDADSDSDSSLEPLPKLKGKRREATQGEKQDDLEFVKNYRNDLIGKMNWKTYLSVGHEKNYCQNYSTGESLRRFFYNATKK